MDESDARERGYSFTGIYSRWREDVAVGAEKIKKQGYKTAIIPSKASGYERSAGVGKGMVLGYSVYAERRYFTDKKRVELVERLKAIPAKKARAYEEYQKLIETIHLEAIDLQKRIVELGG